MTKDCYQIITDAGEFNHFVDWLPDLEEGEKFYGSLFARKKYCQDVPWIKSDKAQLKRFCATKENLALKISQLEVPVGCYQTRNGDGNAVPQEALAVYLTPNPRNLWKATLHGVGELVKMIQHENKTSNPHQELMSCIQRSKSRTIRVSFDIDTKDLGVLEQCRDACLDKCDVLETRGGYHIFVVPSDMKGTVAEKSWHRNIAVHADVTGDSMMPIPGCFQGGFTPMFID